MKQSKILIALDGMDLKTATVLGTTLAEHVAGGKGNDLLDEGGAKVLTGMGFRVRFADPKIKDIPQTVYNRIKKYIGHAEFVTLHGTNSFAALKKAAEAIRESNGSLRGIVISVTTDINESQCRKIYGMSVKRKVVQIVNRAKAAGLDGIVCSPKEVALVRKMWPLAIIIVPGVRSPGEDVHDQVRVGTPYQAILDGADFLVCGREITKAGASDSEKIEAACRINAAVLKAWTQRYGSD